MCIWSRSSGLPLLCSLARQPGGEGEPKGGGNCCSQEMEEGSITHHRVEWLGENVAFGKSCWAVNPVSFAPVTARAQSGWVSLSKLVVRVRGHTALL